MNKAQKREYSTYKVFLNTNVKNIGKGKSTVEKGGTEDLKIHKPASFPELVINLLINPCNK